MFKHFNSYAIASAIAIGNSADTHGHDTATRKIARSAGQIAGTNFTTSQLPSFSNYQTFSSLYEDHNYRSQLPYHRGDALHGSAYYTSVALSNSRSGRAIQGSMFHQNLESKIGQYLKVQYNLPFEAHSVTDPLKAATIPTPNIQVEDFKPIERTFSEWLKFARETSEDFVREGLYYFNIRPINSPLPTNAELEAKRTSLFKEHYGKSYYLDYLAPIKGERGPDIYDQAVISALQAGKTVDEAEAIGTNVYNKTIRTPISRPKVSAKQLVQTNYSDHILDAVNAAESEAAMAGLSQTEVKAAGQRAVKDYINWRSTNNSITSVSNSLTNELRNSFSRETNNSFLYNTGIYGGTALIGLGILSLFRDKSKSDQDEFDVVKRHAEKFRSLSNGDASERLAHNTTQYFSSRKRGSSLTIDNNDKIDIVKTAGLLAETSPTEIGIVAYKDKLTLTKGAATSASYKWLGNEHPLAVIHTHPKSGIAGFGETDLENYFKRLEKYGSFVDIVAGRGGKAVALVPTKDGMGITSLNEDTRSELAHKLFSMEESRAHGGLGEYKLNKAYENLGFHRSSRYMKSVRKDVIGGYAWGTKYEGLIQKAETEERGYYDTDTSDHDSFAYDKDSFKEETSHTKNLLLKSHLLGMAAGSAVGATYIHQGFREATAAGKNFSEALTQGLMRPSMHTMDITLAAGLGAASYTLAFGKNWEERLQGAGLSVAARVGDLFGYRVGKHLLLKNEGFQKATGSLLSTLGDVLTSSFEEKDLPFNWGKELLKSGEALATGAPSKEVVHTVSNLLAEFIGTPLELFVLAPFIGKVFGRFGKVLDKNSSQTQQSDQDAYANDSILHNSRLHSSTSEDMISETSFSANNESVPGQMNMRLRHRDQKIDDNRIDEALHNYTKYGFAYSRQ